MSPRSIYIASGVCFLLVFGFCAISAMLHRPDSRETGNRNATGASAAQAALDAGEIARARQLARETAQDDPDWPKAQLILGAVASRSGDPQTALRHYRAIPRDGSGESLDAELAAARIEQEAGRLSAAIDCFAYVVEHDPEHVQARQELADLYAQTGERWLADVHFRVLVKSREFNFRQRVWMTDFERLDPSGIGFLQQSAESAPDDPAVNLGLAVESMASGDLDSARRHVEIAVQGDPTLGAAQGLLGKLLLDEDEEALWHWHERLPEPVQGHPDIWQVRGQWAQRRGEDRIAVRCFWEAARQTPTSHRAMHQLALAISAIDPDIGSAFAQRATDIYELRQHLSDGLNSFGRNEGAMRRVVEMLLESGREWEAWSWALFLSDKTPDSLWALQVLRGLSEYPDTAAPRILESHDLLARHDLSHYPGFDEFLRRYSTIPAPVAGAGQRPGIRFLDEAAALGIDFSYHQGRVAGLDGVRLQESTGGGIGVLDYEGDGLPDLFLTQGEDWPEDSDVPAPSGNYQDRLFRNVGAGFRDVTDAARVPVEGGFGQGCSAGDFNNDGFIDLYIANIGANQLLMNQGDGTFHDATTESGLTSTVWTASCLIADLNADGHPDLFDVNYVEGERIFRIICEEHNCNPSYFSDAADDLHLSRGDGSIQTIDLADVERGGSPGLAIVAFRPDAPLPVSASSAADVVTESAAQSTAGLSDRSQQRPGLFIANDREPNFFLTSVSGDNAADFHFSELGFLSGLAVNYRGDPTACMGVASGDANGDGLVDLFVTNYRAEANNLYLQSPGGSFSDAIPATGLLAPGLPHVGWGTQFLDADNDGRSDLVVTNGHVGDFRREEGEYFMPTQFFYNLGGCRFEELTPDDVGPFFKRKMLGRSLATLDWNRDGLTDFAVSPIASPFALLTNGTIDAGNFITLRLHAVSTARDAVGTIVTIVTDAGQSRQQLTAGDGYQATNERVLRFGLGRQQSVKQIVIDWPGGLTEIIEGAPANSLLDVVEGRGHAFQKSGSLPVGNSTIRSATAEQE